MLGFSKNKGKGEVKKLTIATAIMLLVLPLSCLTGCGGGTSTRSEKTAPASSKKPGTRTGKDDIVRAVKDGDAARVRALLAEGADVNAEEPVLG